MSAQTPRHEITMKKLVLDLAGTEGVTVRRDVEYGMTDSGPLVMDLYYPPAAASGSRLPAVVIVGGYPDVGVPMVLGCTFREMEFCIGWARLIAQHGMVAIVGTSQHPATDAETMIRYARQHAAPLGIDEQRIGLYAASGAGPNALSLLMSDAGKDLKCAVLSNVYTLDVDGSTGVAQAAAQFRFVNPAARKTIGELPQNVPMFLVRSGRDEMPSLNEALDRFVGHALARNLPITVVNHAAAPHAFDVFHDSDASREIIRQWLAFLRFHLRGRAGG
jgi:acetyl esterase/lipase